MQNKWPLLSWLQHSLISCSYLWKTNSTQNGVNCAHCMIDKMYFFFPGGDAELELVDSLDPFSEVIRIIERVMQRSLNLNLDEEKLRFIES